jgi:hypothetical protein
VVKDIKSRQTNVGDFFLIESNCRVRRQSIARRTNGRSGRAARQRQRPSDSQYRYGFRPTLSLRISVAMRHGWRPSHFTPAPSSISTVRLAAYRFNGSGSLAMFAALHLSASKFVACITFHIDRARIFHPVSSNRVGIHSRCSSRHPSQDHRPSRHPSQDHRPSRHPSQDPRCSMRAGVVASDGARSHGGHKQRRFAERGLYWAPQRQAAPVSLPRRASQSLRLKVEL